LPARVQVHWNSVTSRFPNHDTVFESTSTDELNETGFLAHIELHSGRSSAGSVSKKLHLSGISEEVVEEAPALSELKSESVETAIASKPEEIKPSDLLAPIDLSSHPKRISSLVTTAAATSAALQESLADSSQANVVPEVSITPEESPDRPITADPNNNDGESRYMVNTNSADSFPPALDASGRRFSTQSARPSTSDNYSSSLYDYDMLYKPKVKLGPRPSMDRRPPSSKGQAVATLPAGLRSSRVGLSSARPKSRDSTLRPKSRDSSMSSYKVPPPPPIPESSPYSFTPRPSSSGNSVKSLPATLPKSPGMSREKQRLMKFREMYREKENQKGKATVVLSRAERAKAANEDVFAEEADNEAEESNDLETLDESEQTGLPIPAKSIDRTSRAIPGSILKPSRQNAPSTPSGDFPRTSGESLSASPGVGNASSPISTVDSSARAASTRPTSVSDSSDLEKAPRSEKETTTSTPSINSSGGATEVTTPRTVVDDKISHDEDAHSTTTSSTTPTGNGTATAKADENHQDPPSERVVSSSSHLSASDRRQMRRALVSPITVPTDTSDAHLSDAHLSESDADASYDEDFMDELHDAVVVEAKSMLVSKSPITPFLSRRPSAQLIDSTTPMPRAYSPLPSPSIMHLDRTPTVSPARGAGKSPLISTSESSVSEVTLTSVPQELVHEPRPTANDKSSVINNIDDSEAEHGGKDGEEHDNARRPSNISRSNSSTMLNNADRTPSFTLLTPTYPAVSPGARSPSGSFLSSIPQQKEEAIIVSKKGRLGSGVASKIADLQRSFSRGSSPGDAAPLPLPAARSFSSSRKPLISQRAGSLTDPQPRGSTPPRSSSSQFTPSFPIRDAGSVRGRAMSKGSLMSFDSRETKNSTPTRNHSSGSIGPRRLDNRRLSIYDSPPLPQVEFNDRRDTIQVKATIIRTDGPYMKPESQQFMESPLVITQQRATSPAPVQTVLPPVTALPARSSSLTKEANGKKHKRQRSSISAALRGFKSPSSVTLSETISSQGVGDRENTNRQSMDLGSSWRTLTRRASVQLSRSPSAARSPSTEKPSVPFSRSPSARDSDRKSMVSPPSTNGERGSLGRSMSISSMDSVTTTDSQQNGTDAKKKGNRASRLMKRMSNGMSSIASVTRLQLGTLNEVESGKDKRGSVLEEKEENQRGAGWRAVEVGDLNVQFPDTLVSLSIPFHSRRTILLTNG
jgi:hypothetical protein